MVKYISDDDFEKEIDFNGVVVVDFFAKWCGPCRGLSPVLDEISEKYSSNVKILKMDVDENVKIPTKFNVRSIPTLLFYKNGENKNQIVGSVGKAQLEEIINNL